MRENEFEYSVFFPNPESEITFLKWLAETNNLPDRIELLDVGCGFGRMLLAFDALGWKVMAVEPDPDFYEQVRLHETILPQVSVRLSGFLDICEQDKFDMVVAVNDPFAYLTSFSDRIEALRRIYCSLKRGGIVMLDVPNFIYVLDHYKPLEERIVNTQRRKYRRTTRRLLDFHDNTWTNIDEYEMVDELGETWTTTKSQRLAILNYPELEHLLRTQGFGEIRTYNSYAERTVGRLMGKRILVSAQKPHDAP